MKRSELEADAAKWAGHNEAQRTAAANRRALHWVRAKAKKPTAVELPPTTEESSDAAPV